MENPPPLEEQPAIHGRPKRFLIVAGAVLAILVVAAISVYAWYAVYGPCSKSKVKTASDLLFNQVQAFDAAYQLAASLPPIELIRPMTQMEQTLVATQAVIVPACMQAAKNELTTSMDSALRAFLAIMNLEPEKRIKNLLQDSKTHLENFTNELESVNKCTPFCL